MEQEIQEKTEEINEEIIEIEEKKYNEEYELIMNGEIKNFDTLEEVLRYVRKHGENLYYCSIRKTKTRIRVKINESKL